MPANDEPAIGEPEFFDHAVERVEVIAKRKVASFRVHAPAESQQVGINELSVFCQTIESAAKGVSTGDEAMQQHKGPLTPPCDANGEFAGARNFTATRAPGPHSRRAEMLQQPCRKTGGGE